MLKGRHRDEPAPVRALRQLLAALVAHWQIAVLVVLGVLALIFAAATAASAHPATTPPQTGLITSGAEAGVTAGTS